ncbi:RHS repeat domain-containing protein [Candidatus Omnitrophota bacterium]
MKNKYFQTLGILIGIITLIVFFAGDSIAREKGMGLGKSAATLAPETQDDAAQSFQEEVVVENIQQSSSSNTAEDPIVNFGGSIDTRGGSSGLVNIKTGEPVIKIPIEHYVGSESEIKFPLQLTYRDWRNGFGRIGYDGWYYYCCKNETTPTHWGVIGDGYCDQWIGPILISELWNAPYGTGWNLSHGFIEVNDPDGDSETHNDIWEVFIPGRGKNRMRLKPNGGHSPYPCDIDGNVIEMVYEQWYEFYAGDFEEPQKIILYEETPGFVKIEYAFFHDETFGDTLKFRFTYPDGVHYTFAPLKLTSYRYDPDRIPHHTWRTYTSNQEWMLEEIGDRNSENWIRFLYPEHEEYPFFVAYDNVGNRIDFGTLNEKLKITVKRRGTIVAEYEGTLEKIPTFGHYQLTSLEVLSNNGDGQRRRLYEFDYYADYEYDGGGAIKSVANSTGGTTTYTYKNTVAVDLDGQVTPPKDIYIVDTVTLDDGRENEIVYSYFDPAVPTGSFRSGEEVEPEERPRYVLYPFSEIRPDGTGFWSFNNARYNFTGPRYLLGLPVTQYILTDPEDFESYITRTDYVWDGVGRSADPWDPEYYTGFVPVLMGKATELKSQDLAASVTTFKEYEYNDRGQIRRVKDYGFDGVSGDETLAEMEYAYEAETAPETKLYPEMEERHLYSFPYRSTKYEMIEATGDPGEKLSEEITLWEMKDPTNLFYPYEIKTWIGDKSGDGHDDYLSSLVQYDSTGLLLSETTPSGIRTSYLYDELLYPRLATATTVERSGESNLVTYQSYTPLGLPEVSTDVNDFEIKTYYDGFNRPIATMLEEETTPCSFNSAEFCSSEIFYNDDFENNFPTSTMTITYNRDENPGDSIDRPHEEVYAFVDGFGRNIQTRRCDASSAKDVVETIEYNNLGLMERQYYPVVTPHQTTFDENHKPSTAFGYPGQYEEFIYSTDGLQRVASVSTPNPNTDVGAPERITVNNYYGDNYVISTIDIPESAEDIITKTTKDYFGQITEVIEDYQESGGSSNTANTTTTYEYDLLGNMTRMTDPEGKITEYKVEPWGESFVDSPDMAGDARDANGDFVTGESDYVLLMDRDGRVWDERIFTDNFLRPEWTFLSNTARVGRTYIRTQYDGLDRPYHIFSGSWEHDQDIPDNPLFNRDINSDIWYDDYTMQERYNADGLGSIHLIMPPAEDALGNNDRGEGDSNALEKVTKETSSGGNMNSEVYFYDQRGTEYAKKIYIDLDGDFTAQQGYEVTEGFEIKYAYDDLDNVIAIKYPYNHVLKQNYDALGRLISQCYDDGAEEIKLAEFIYHDDIDQRDQLYQIILDPDGENSLILTYDYAANNMLGRIQAHVEGNSTAIYDRTYIYDELGNVKTMGAFENPLANFTYDPLSRLVGVEDVAHPILGEIYQGDSSYTFDSFGNRTGRTKNGSTEIYSYWPGTNILQSGGIEPGANYVTDERGRRTIKIPLANPNRHEVMLYNTNDQIMVCGTHIIDPPSLEIQAEYTYNNQGKRVLKKNVSENRVTAYIYGGLDVLMDLEFDLDTSRITKWANYIYAGGKKIAKFDSTGWQLSFYVNDALSSTNMIVDRNGQIVMEHQRSPYGNYVSGDTEGERYLYTNREVDAESGLTYMNARYYDSEIGRFVTLDSYLGKAESPQTRNPFTYALNNPMKYYDPTGNYPTPYDGYDIIKEQGDIDRELSSYLEGEQREVEASIDLHNSALDYIKENAIAIRTDSRIDSRWVEEVALISIHGVTIGITIGKDVTEKSQKDYDEYIDKAPPIILPPIDFSDFTPEDSARQREIDKAYSKERAQHREKAWREIVREALIQRDGYDYRDNLIDGFSEEELLRGDYDPCDQW